MSYDWRPTAARSATTNPNIVTGAARAHADRARADAGADLSVAAAVDRFLAAAESGAALNRSGRPYRPSAMRDLRGILEYHVLPALGEVRLRAVRRPDVQALVDQLGDEGLSESRIRSVVSALRALFGHAIEQGWTEHNPADALVMPDGAERPAPAGEPRRWTDEAARMVEDQAAGVRDRLGELWEDRPRWEDRPGREERRTSRDDWRTSRDDQRTSRDDRGMSRDDQRTSRDDWGMSREDRGTSRARRDDGGGRERRAASADEPPARERDADYEPIVLLPERIVSVALKVAVAAFVLLALVSLVEST